MTRAILMAAGVGSRISTSIQKPKSTLRIENTTLIAHSAKMLTDAGIQVAVVVGYKKEVIFNALYEIPVTYFFSPFYKVTNSMASLWFARDFLRPDVDVILANADVFWEESILEDLLQDDHRFVMMADRKRVQEGDYFFKTTSDGFLSAYGKDLLLQNRDCEYVGMAKIQGSAIRTFKGLLEDAVEQEVYNMWWENVLYDNSLDNPVYIKDVNGKFWGEVDTIEDYNRILFYLEQHKK